MCSAAGRIKTKIKVLGLTGCFGSGKTTSAGMFKRLGAVVIDADQTYHQLIDSTGGVYKKIISVFGRDILTTRGEICRKKLGDEVFAEPKLLKKLIRITHPAIISSIKQRLKRLSRNQKQRLVLVDAPLLIEAGLLNIVDTLIVVKAKQGLIVKRLKKAQGLSKQMTIKRIRSQAPLSVKVKLADYVIDNSGTLAQTRKQVRKIWQDLTV
ncbi:dephospho-CoA kinase [Candidatus Omnitrophota bacterium]